MLTFIDGILDIGKPNFDFVLHTGNYNDAYDKKLIAKPFIFIFSLLMPIVRFKPSVLGLQVECSNHYATVAQPTHSKI